MSITTNYGNSQKLEAKQSIDKVIDQFQKLLLDHPFINIEQLEIISDTLQKHRRNIHEVIDKVALSKSSKLQLAALIDDNNSC